MSLRRPAEGDCRPKRWLRGTSLTAPLEIALVSDAVFPYHAGGKETRYRHISSELSRQGHRVTVYTMHWWDGPPCRRAAEVNYRAIMPKWPMYRGRRRSMAQALLFALACLRLLAYRFDLVEADQMPYLQLLTLKVVCTVRRVPLVVTWHELWGRRYWRQYLGPLGAVAAAVESLATRLPDLIVTDSPETHDRLIGAGAAPGRVTTIPPGVDLEKIAAAPSVPGFDLVFVGRLISHKGVDLALRSLDLLRRRGVEATLGIVGTGPQEAELRRLAAELDLSAAVSFLGRLDDETALFSLMKGSRLLLLPSTREGFGLVVLEAAAAGLPTITVDHPDNYARQLVIPGRTGWICAPTVEALAGSIDDALTTPLDLGEAAASLVAEHRWALAGAQTSAAYLAALVGRPLTSSEPTPSPAPERAASGGR